MGLIMKAIMVVMIIGLAFYVYADVDFEDPETTYGNSMTLAEFKLLSDSALTNWDVEYRGTEQYYDDTQYYYYMNVFDYWRDDEGTETITPVRDTFIIGCDSNLYNCTSFYIAQVLENQNSYFNYFKELQDEL